MPTIRLTPTACTSSPGWYDLRYVGNTSGLRQVVFTIPNNETLGGAPDLKEGAQLLDGYQALSYSRIRKIDSDFQRTQRQQNVIRALVERARSLSWISLARLAVRYLGEVETDLSLGDLSALLPLARQADLSNLQSARVPFEGAYEEAVIDGMQVLVPDLEANRAQLAAFWDAP